MSLSFELEIKHALDQVNSDRKADLQAVAEQLISSLEGSGSDLNSESINALCRFLLHAELNNELIQFVLRHFREEQFPIPWPYFLNAIQNWTDEISPELADALLAGIDETKAREIASLSKALDFRSPTLSQVRADRRINALKSARELKEQLLEQLLPLRTQQLYEQEKLILEKLRRMFPKDPDVIDEVRSHKERYALEILTKHSRLSKEFRFEEKNLDQKSEIHERELLASFFEAVEKSPSLAFDFSVAAAMLEAWEEALALLEYSEESDQARWLKLELLLGAGRFLELLQELTHIEVLHAHDPETFFATAYLRAQALWGLGQKHSAIEVMESLLAARPHYRSGLSLLNIWRAK